jgi:hypothetical protein
MSMDAVKNKRIWVPERTYGVCIWVLPDGQALSDGDGFLSAEGFVGDKDIENKVLAAAKYWTGSDEGEVAWVHGARKITASERDDQVDRLNNGHIPDPYEDFFDGLRKHGK